MVAFKCNLEFMVSCVIKLDLFDRLRKFKIPIIDTVFSKSKHTYTYFISKTYFK